jgi:hypothetical protein
MDYKTWMARVNEIVEDTCGVPMEWLPDWLSRDAYDDGASPQAGAQICLDTAGYETQEQLLEID